MSSWTVPTGLSCLSRAAVPGGAGFSARMTQRWFGVWWRIVPSRFKLVPRLARKKSRLLRLVVRYKRGGFPGYSRAWARVWAIVWASLLRVWVLWGCLGMVMYPDLARWVRGCAASAGWGLRPSWAAAWVSSDRVGLGTARLLGILLPLARLRAASRLAVQIRWRSRSRMGLPLAHFFLRRTALITPSCPGRLVTWASPRGVRMVAPRVMTPRLL